MPPSRPQPADLDRLLADHADDLEAIVRRYVDDPADQDDLRQEIAIALWHALPRFRGEASERTYVARVARNRAVTFCLRQARRRALFHELPEELAAPRPDTGELDLPRLRAAVAEALGQLPSAQRDVVALAAAGYTPVQIAERTGQSGGAVRVALHRARQSLRRWLHRPGAPPS